MALPEPIELLFDWIERNGFAASSKAWPWYGMLYSPDGTQLGTEIVFYPDDNEHLHYWFGYDEPEVLNRVCVFARTGGEGSMAAFWLDPVGQQRIVHLGSGSGSVLTCVLADNPIDFLRLLAIGYDELCWDEEYGEPPNARRGLGDPYRSYLPPNTAFQEWVRATFEVDIPNTALQIVKHRAHMWTEDCEDSFCRWLKECSDCHE